MNLGRSNIVDVRARESGVALIVVLWLVVVLALQVSVLNQSIRDGVRLAENGAALANGQVLMHAAIEIAAARLAAPETRERWTANGGPHLVFFAGSELTISISDENGRINLNTADPALLEGLFRSLTGSASDAAMLADRIVDWRDPDHERRPKGAEDPDYRSAGLEHGAGDQPFLDTSDITRVLGMSRSVAELVMPHVTIYTRDGRINPLLASPEVVRSLPNIRPDTIEEALRLRSQGGEAALAVHGELAAARQFLSTSRGPAYRIKVQIDGDRRVALGWGEAIIMIGLDGAAPYRVLAWRFRSSVGQVVAAHRQGS